MSFLAKIQQIIAADIIDIKPQLKQKKLQDKEKRQEEIKPDFAQAKVSVITSRAYAGGYELQISVPVAAEFLRDKKKKKENFDSFITQLHEFVHDRIGVWMGRPFLGGVDDRAKNGMVTIKASWHFDDAYFAYALGLDLTSFYGSNEVVEKSKIATRMNLAKKAMKEMQGFKDLANKKLKLRSQNEKEQDKIWKEEFRDDFVKLADKWKEKGISYSTLRMSKQEKSRAFGSIIQSHYEV